MSQPIETVANEASMCIYISMKLSLDVLPGFMRRCRSWQFFKNKKQGKTHPLARGYQFRYWVLYFVGRLLTRSQVPLRVPQTPRQATAVPSSWENHRAVEARVVKFRFGSV